MIDDFDDEPLPEWKKPIAYEPTPKPKEGLRFSPGLEINEGRKAERHGRFVTWLKFFWRF